ncbi:MAG TPA: inorganic diphosphatase [Ktedonobacterales bacterium]|nr:inorganic diphosphatase [Ktedonobacterales bacterium]
MKERALSQGKSTTDARLFLGRQVLVKVDRPLGSIHPRHDDIYYPVNYGFVPGTISPDGCELDVYLLGIFVPVETYTGICIGVIHRTNDDDKLIVVPEGKTYTRSQIRALTEFQERFFTSILITLPRQRSA